MKIDSYKTYTVVLKNGFVCTVVDRKTTINEHAICFYDDGTVKALSSGLSTGNDNDYDIAQILQQPLPALPAGYNWAGGWPTIRAIKDGEYYLTNYPEYYSVHYNADLNRHNELRGYKRIALEKIGALSSDPPKKDPEEYVVQNVVPCRPEDMCLYTVDKTLTSAEGYSSRLWRANEKSPRNEFYPVGKMHGETVQGYAPNHTLNVFCKRKDLPVATPMYPIYYLHLPENQEYAKFVIRISETEAECTGHDGKPFTSGHGRWNHLADEAVRTGQYKLSSKEEYDNWLASLQYPIYYKLKNDTVGSKFVVKTDKDHAFVLRNDGTQSAQFSWNKADDQSLEDGDYILASKEEFDTVLKSLAPPPMYTAIQSPTLKAPANFDMHDFTNFKCEVTPPKSKSRAAFDYFVVEPSVNMARVATSSLRYVLLVSVVSTIGYCVTHPSEFKKALPKINFKIEKPEILE